MENLQPFAHPIPSDNPASGQLAEEKLAVDVGPASTSSDDQGVESLQFPPLSVASSSDSTHAPEANDELDKDELDARLAEARVSRAKTFSKVTNLFTKIFVE